ncbi:MAG: hypothetical protein ABIP17_03480, partial [Ilumatobacteraceae bacterium]
DETPVVTTSDPTPQTSGQQLGSDFDSAALVRTDLMELSPDPAAPGELVSIRFPTETLRGIGFTLDRWTGDGWTSTHFLTSGAGGDGQTWAGREFIEGLGWDDLGISGPGPDVVRIPTEASAGAYRLCTGNARPNFCALIMISVDSSSPTSATPDLVALVGVHQDVEFYPACMNEPTTMAGTTWYPVAEWGNDELADLYATITSVVREQPTGPAGFAGVPRVVAPGPGDDVGTLTVWADGVAHFVSLSGLDAWLVDDELSYNWVC